MKSAQFLTQGTDYWWTSQFNNDAFCAGGFSVFEMGEASPLKVTRGLSKPPADSYISVLER